MRRNVGISGLQRNIKKNEQFKEVGQVMATAQLDQLKEQLDIFKQNLTDFARKYQKQIRKDPVFRNHFQKMCASIGVDPLASNKGFWAELLGVGDFYYELGIHIIQVCLASRATNGGLLEFSEMKRSLQAIRTTSPHPATDDDIRRAIAALKPLGTGFRIVVFNNKEFVCHLPQELNTEQTTILSQAEKTGFVTTSMMEGILGWSEDAVLKALNDMIEEGLCWVDTQAESYQYWFPCHFPSF